MLLIIHSICCAIRHGVYSDRHGIFLNFYRYRSLTMTEVHSKR